MMDLPSGWGYNVPTILLLGWAVTDILIFVAVFPLLRKRALLYRLIKWGEGQMTKNPAEVELDKVRNRG